MWEYAIRELSRKKRRTAATLLGYAVAVAVITIILHILWNGRMASDAILRSTGTHFAAYIPACTGETCQDNLIDREGEGFYVGQTRVRLLDASLLSLIEGLDSVADAAPFIIFKTTNPDGGTGDITLAGASEASAATISNSCSARDIVSGSFLDGGDYNSVVLEEEFARARNLEPGSSIRILGKEYAVKGIVNTGIRVARADAYLPIAEAEAAVNARLRVPLDEQCALYLVESRSAADHETAVAQVKRLMGAQASVSSYNCYKPASLAMGVTGSSALLIALVVFACLLAFSLQAQYSSLVERRHGIGVLAAIGWSRGMIAGQILIESLVQAASGWFAGSLVALAAFAAIPASAIVGSGAGVEKRFFPVVFLIGLGLALSGGAAAGLIPGLSAASRKPADCLRRP
jgi:putative ABC transport system permease protein